jgi:hypothetical protein
VYNEKLSENRAETIKRYLLHTFPFLNPVPLYIKGLGENWVSFRREVVNDEQIPFRKQLLRIIDDPSLDYNQKELKIKQLAKGETYRYLAENILPSQRRGEICVLFRQEIKKEVFPEVEPEKPLEEKIPETGKTDTVAIIPYQEPVVQKNRFWAIKTNLFQLGAGVANLGVEYPVGDRFSIDLPVTYSPYTIKSNWKIRTLTLQPEFRWWWNSPMKGHFLGVHGHVGYYNVSLDRFDRYQDKNGDTPLWGGGLSYGYALPLKGAWNLEFTAGAGYAHLVYDIFYNVENGARYETSTKDYWGLTRIGITLVYTLNIRK